MQQEGNYHQNHYLIRNMRQQIIMAVTSEEKPDIESGRLPLPLLSLVKKPVSGFLLSNCFFKFSLHLFR